jgi:hypothetical protein
MAGQRRASVSTSDTARDGSISIRRGAIDASTSASGDQPFGHARLRVSTARRTRAWRPANPSAARI